jgi:acetolactate synthase I/II/III large subunit
VKQRVADYITNALYCAGGEHVFMVTGGMIMHLSDALLVHGKQKYTCCHHEQAAVMAAEAYGRFTGALGVAYVTAGPGALNTLTGVVGAWVDSSPCVIVSGQAKAALAKVTGPRQFALQGFNTRPIFEQVTKYAVMLDDVSRVKHEVEKSIHLAKTGRVGPVWIECPLDVQGTVFDPDQFEGYVPEQVRGGADLGKSISAAKAMLLGKKRPLVLAGAGVRLAGGIDELQAFVGKTGIPFITSRLGMDMADHDDPLFVGRPGTYGDRAANFAVQNSDVLIVVGCRLGIGLVSYDYKAFADRAKKIIVDIDERELAKPSVVPDLAICADAKAFLAGMNEALGGAECGSAEWRQQAQIWKKRYPVDLPEYVNETDGVNSYHFMRVFSEQMPADQVFLVDTGSCFHVHAQAFKVKYGQRHIITGGLSTMGYMPASIGVAVARASGCVYCITGDGSIQMNIQELQTIVGNKLPIKLIVLSNDGYLLIRNTQRNFMDGRLIGESPRTGVTLPDLEKLSAAYGMQYMRIEREADLATKIDELKASTGPIICEVKTPADQLLIPRVSSKQLEDGTMVSMPYDDMFPFLPRDEYEENCVRARAKT